MHWNPYLTFDGTCEEAFRHYEKCLGGTVVTMMSFGESPAREFVPSDEHHKIMHARLVRGDMVLMGSDNHAGAPPFEAVKGCSVAVHVQDPAEAETLFNALSEGGTVTMPFQETFWAHRFGMAVDRFGIPWMVNCELTA